MNVYVESNGIADRAMEKLNDIDVSVLAKHYSDEVYSKLHDTLKQWLLDDTQANIAFEIRRMVDGSIQALLSNDPDLMARYPYAQYEKGESIRAELVKLCHDEVMSKRIEDLENKVKMLKESIELSQRF
jgi:hypothetical protein